MKDLLKLAIIDNNPELIKEMAQTFTDSGFFDVVGTAADGDSGLELLNTTDVDILIIDLVLPKKDGLYVMEKAAEKGAKKPMMVVYSHYGAEPWAARLSNIGAMVMQKPFCHNLMMCRILEKWNAKKIVESNNNGGWKTELTPLVPITAIPPIMRETNPKIYIRQLLTKMGAPNSLSGRGYIQTAFTLIVKSKEDVQGDLVNRIYPAVAKIHGKSPAAVERSIRYLIARTAEKKYMRNVFNQAGLVGIEADEKIPISEFLTSLIYCYQMDVGVED